jgi:hypothetical protein
MHYDAAHSVSLHVIATDPAAVSAMRAPAKRGTEAAEGQAEIGPGLAAPASPIPLSREGGTAGGVDQGNPPPKPQRSPSGPESCLGGDTVTATASIVDLP